MIKNQFMITEHHAGDCLAAARVGNPTVACGAGEVPAGLATQADRVFGG
jgi:hypothetical protein